MIGDIILIKPAYIKTAEMIIDFCPSSFFKQKRVVFVAGESGSGKSVTAVCLQKVLLEQKIDAFILHQDDYFYLPPASNHAARETDISKVGLAEVNLQLLQSHVNAFLKNEAHIVKPLVYYKENQIIQDTINITPYQVLIIEGTYSFFLENADLKVFMERNYKDTLESRIERARDISSDFLELVLQIEHELISPCIKKADLLVKKNYQVEKL